MELSTNPDLGAASREGSFARRVLLGGLAALGALAPGMGRAVSIEPVRSPGPPRIPPVMPTEVTGGAQDFFTMVEGPGGSRNGTRLNLILTLARHPALAISYFTFGKYILNGSTLPARLRELATLRTAALYNCPYEWTKHARRARAIGITGDEIVATTLGSSSPVWTNAMERALLAAVEQMQKTTTIDDDTWRVLSTQLDYKQLMDFLFTVGQYAMLAMVVNSIRVVNEPAS